MVIGPDDVMAPVVEPVLVLLPLQAARTPTESATALIAATFLENQGRLYLNARFLLPSRSGIFRVEPIGDIGMLTFEGYTGRLRLLRDKRRENNVTVTPGPMLLGSSDAGGTCPLHAGPSAE